MKTLALAGCLFAVAALAQGPATPASEPPPAPGFKPRPVTKGGDKKGIEELYKSTEAALKKGDVEALAARVDFPLMMLTDNAAGVPATSLWEKATWVETMKRAVAGLPKEAKLAKKTRVTFISDSLAMVEESNEKTIGKTKEKWTSGAIVELKDGKWMFKAMLEGGWGELMPPPKAEAPSADPARTPIKPGEPARK